MTELSPAFAAPEVEAHVHSTGAVLRFIVIALTAFLTVVDLFATQAILPVAHQALWRHAGAMGFAVNASTMGMAVSGLAVGYFSRSIDRRMGILLSLLVLADPDRSARACTRPHHLHPIARGAGALHGCGLHPDACLSRRALQRGRLGQRVCRLHHRERRQQSDRAADLSRE